MNKLKVLFMILVLSTVFFATACGQAEDSGAGTDDGSEVTQEEAAIPIVYEDNDKINLFINNYNIANPDDTIESDMVEKDEHHGQIHDDQVNILKDDDFEVNLSDVYPFKVFIKGYQTQDNDRYKELVFKYAKGIDPTLTDDKLEDYWSQTMDNLTHIVDFDEFELRLNLFHDNIEYLTICGNVKD